jgi:formylglycine-generating enzyme required for sulfatase activity
MLEFHHLSKYALWLSHSEDKMKNPINKKKMKKTQRLKVVRGGSHGTSDTNSNGKERKWQGCDFAARFYGIRLVKSK